MVALSLCLVFARLDSLVYRRAQQNHQEALRLWTRRLADAAFDGLLIHRNGTILAMNRSLLRLLGCREAELLGQNFATMAVPAQAGQLRAELEAPASEVVEFTLVTVDKVERRVEMSSQSIEHDGLPATVTAIRDITRAKADRERIDLLMHHDQLTGLANRTLFAERLTGAIAQNDMAGGTTALLVMDVDQLKAINDRLGRAGGDQLLRQITGRLRTIAHESDTVARIGGDKFGIVQPHTGAPNRLQAMVSKLEVIFSQAFVIEGQMVKASVSIGMAVYPDHAADAEGLMRAADFALGIAGAGGGGVSHMFSHAEAENPERVPGGGVAGGARRGDKRAIEARGVEARQAQMDSVQAGPAEAPLLAQDLRAAIRRGELSLEYQPVFRARDLSLAGFEALCRWRHPLKGWIPPGIFIPLAEEAGVIHEVGAFVLETACAKAAAAGETYVMAVNLSPLQFRDPQLAPKVSEILRRTGLNPSLLELEVTESLLIDDAAAAQNSLKALRSIGVSVALDDFGTGYSSLSYLCDFPFTRLKIDKRFVQALGQDANADAIVTAIVALARNLKLEVTAEGVETVAQLTALQELGCNLVQGFLLGRPGTHVATLQALVKQTGGPAKPSLVIAN